jgi:hypothetical protein
MLRMEEHQYLVRVQRESWFVENPGYGAFRKLPCVVPYIHSEQSRMLQYGDYAPNTHSLKPTIVLTNCTWWHPWPMRLAKSVVHWNRLSKKKCPICSSILAANSSSLVGCFAHVKFLEPHRINFAVSTYLASSNGSLRTRIRSPEAASMNSAQTSFSLTKVFIYSKAGVVPEWLILSKGMQAWKGSGVFFYFAIQRDLIIFEIRVFINSCNVRALGKRANQVEKEFQGDLQLLVTLHAQNQCEVRLQGNFLYCPCRPV